MLGGGEESPAESQQWLLFRAPACKQASAWAQLALEERAGGLPMCEQLVERMVLAQFGFWYSWSRNPEAESWSLF